MGAGFASGREIWQFFGVFGKQGSIGIIFAALLLHEELKVQYIIAVILVAIGIHVVNSR